MVSQEQFSKYVPSRLHATTGSLRLVLWLHFLVLLVRGCSVASVDVETSHVDSRTSLTGRSAVTVKSDEHLSWRVRGSYFEACNCEAICPCRSVHGRPGGPSSFGVCYGAVSWHVQSGHAGPVDLSDLRAVLSLRYRDDVAPTTLWEVVLYVDERADEQQRHALADIFLGRAGGTVADQYGPAIGDVHAVRSARIDLEHVAPRKRIGVVGYLTIEAEGAASEEDDVQCGIPGFDHPGTELHGDVLRSTDELLRWEVRGRRHAAFASDFDYRSAT